MATMAGKSVHALGVWAFLYPCHNNVKSADSIRIKNEFNYSKISNTCLKKRDSIANPIKTMLNGGVYSQYIEDEKGPNMFRLLSMLKFAGLAMAQDISACGAP